MEKIEKVSKTVIDTTHHFYCDDCNIYLGNTQEYDDGYYRKLGEFCLHIYLPDGRYEVNKCVCEDCKQEYLESLLEKLIDMGFTKWNY